jgi:hypothetical protein
MAQYFGGGTNMNRHSSHVVPFYCSNKPKLTCRYSDHVA